MNGVTMKINKVLFILLCSFVSVSAMQQGGRQGLSLLLAPAPQRPAHIIQRQDLPFSLDINEFRTIIEAIVSAYPTNGTFARLNETLNNNLNPVTEVQMTADRTSIIVQYSNENSETFNLSTSDTQLFFRAQEAVQNNAETAAEVLADTDQQDSQTTVSELPAPVRTNTTTTLPASTTTTVTNTPAAIPPVLSVSTPAAQQPIVPAEDPVKKKKKDDQTDENSKDKYLPYGYNPYDPNGKDSPSSGGQPSSDQPQQGGGGGRSSRGGKGGNDPYGGYGDQYPGMGVDYYGNPMSVYGGGGGGMNFDKPSGGAGSALSSQVGFAITKPSTTPPQYVTHADVKKLSSQGKSTTIVPQTSTDDTPTDTTYQRTLQLEPETLFHTRKTEPTKRLHIAPVKEEPVTPLNEAPDAHLPKVEKKPVSFFHSLWNTVTQPFVTVMSWFLSFVYRK